MTEAELQAHDDRVDVHFSRTSHFEGDEQCRNCGHDTNGHYDGRCPRQHKE